jgi:hypothetical protein
LSEITTPTSEGWCTREAISDLGAPFSVVIAASSPFEDDPKVRVYVRRPNGQDLAEIDNLAASDLDDFAENLLAAIRVARQYGVIPPASPE